MKRTLLTLAVTSLLTTTAFADPIHTAAKNGDLAGVQAELDKGVDVNKWYEDPFLLGDSKWTPLLFAAVYGHKEVVKLLIAEGANVNVKGAFDEWTPLQLAASEGYKEIVELLISNGADVNAKVDWNGTTPLHEAAMSGHKEIVELLIDNGADVNAKKKGYGYTPLHYAATYGYKEVVELLIAKGADVNAKANNGKTPLDAAGDRNQPETADLLRQYGGKTKQEINKWPNAVGYLFYGRDQLSIYGEIGLKFDVRYSSDLKEWKVLDTVTLESSRQIYLDQSAAEQPMRFYQLRLVE